ncbi:hypothetical protein ACGFR8_36030 [Streptomyces brevispora]
MGETAAVGEGAVVRARAWAVRAVRAARAAVEEEAVEVAVGVGEVVEA